MRNVLFIMLSVVTLLAGCSSVSSDRMTELERRADRAVAKLIMERSGVQGLLRSGAGYAVAEIDRSFVPSGNPLPVNGVLVRNADEARFFVKVSHVEFEGAEGVKILTAVILLPKEEDLAAALSGELDVAESPSINRIFIYADDKRYAVYELESVRIKAVIVKSKNGDDRRMNKPD